MDALMFLVPMIGLVSAWVVFHERVSFRTSAGAFLTIGAVLRVAWPDWRDR